ncbi:MAG: ABC transporter ATP-binding protein [Rubricoccaceae bacterium]
MIAVLRKLGYLFSARDQRNGAILFVLMFVGSALEVVGIGSIPLFVALIADPQRLTANPIVNRFVSALGITDQTSLVLWGAALLVVVFAIKNSYTIFLAGISSRYTQHRRVEIQQRLFRAYLYSPYTYHLGHNSTRLLHTLDRDAEKVISGAFAPVLNITREVIMMTLTAMLLFLVEPTISVVMIGMLGVVSFSYFQLIKPRIARLAKLSQYHHRAQMKAVQQGLHGIKDTKVLGREHYFIGEYKVSAYIRAKEAHQLAVTQAVPRLLLETVVVVAMLFVSGLMVWQGRAPQEIVPVLTLLAVAAVRMIPSFNILSSSFASLKNGEPAIDSVIEDLRELDGSSVPPPRNMTPLSFQSEIRFDNVRFRYPNAEVDALQGLSLTIPRGASVAFVGSSGAGKTTAVDILLGLLEPREGRLLIDGVDITGNTRGWQRQIGYIPQHIYLIDDSLRRNVAFGRKDDEIDDARVWEALEQAQLRELAESLPEGLDTVIGERGVRFSGGQRQRVGIARALYGRPDVLVMDEATSALDNVTERYIVEALERLHGEQTIIVVAHRLSTVRNCDILFLLDGGVLVAQGTYEELMEKSDLFRKMAGAHLVPEGAT